MFDFSLFCDALVLLQCFTLTHFTPTYYRGEADLDILNMLHMLGSAITVSRIVIWKSVQFYTDRSES